MFEYLHPNAASDVYKYEKQEKNALKNQLVAVSRSLAKSRINWTVEEKKLFVMCLTQIKWSKKENNNVVSLSKKDIVDSLGLDLDSSHRSIYLRRAFRKLAIDSEVHWTDPNDSRVWRDDFLIIGRRSNRNEIIVEFNPYFMPHLENLVKNTPYLTIWSSDVYGFKSRFSFALFEDLRLHWDDRFDWNYRDFTTNQLKEIFGLGKNDYIRKDGYFDRRHFEIFTLDRAIDEINKSEMMMIHIQGFNKSNEPIFYKKIKKGGCVYKYQIQYKCMVHTTPYKDQPHERTRGEMIADDVWEAEQMQMQMEDGVWNSNQ